MYTAAEFRTRDVTLVADFSCECGAYTAESTYRSHSANQEFFSL